MNFDEIKIGVIGLGYVGLPLAVEFGKKISVVGYDIDQKRIESLRAGVDTTLECAAPDLMAAKYLQYTFNKNDLADANVYIITVPTPVDQANRPDLTPLVKASQTVGSVLKANDIVIYESTVYPGATEEICVPALEKASGLKFNQDFFCGYSPERINPGDKVNTLVTIKKITSGSTPKVAKIIDDIYGSIITAGTFPAASIKVAEAAKVIENTQRDINIALVNELSVIFDRLDIDTCDVLEAAGTKWNFLPFRPGMVGGHCIGVDPYYLTHKAEEVGYHPQVILAGRRINDDMAVIAARNFIRLMIKNGINVATSTVGVMGVTFKENCPDIRNSKVVDMVRELEGWGVRVKVVDPYADPDDVYREYGLCLDVISSDSPVDSLIVAVGHNVYRQMNPIALKEMCKPGKPVLADLKSLYNRNELSQYGFTVYRL